MLDHPMSQFFIKKRQKGQKASKIQSRPDVCNKFFNGKKRMSNFLAAVFGFLYIVDDGLPDYLGGQFLLLEFFENHQFKIHFFSLSFQLATFLQRSFA